MNKRFLVYTLFLSQITFGQGIPSIIGFGSCGHQDMPLDIYGTIADKSPDLFIFLGDNIYGDTKKMKVLKKKYRKLAKNENFRKLQSSTKILATWDDHDYGQNDAGKYYPKKERSKKIFLKFFEEPKDSDRWKHAGIYTSYYFKEDNRLLQVILLDCRSFRNDLLPYNGSLEGDTNYRYQLDYSPYPIDSDSTMLGEEQWNWLKNELTKPADIRIIGSSTQFATQYNGYEAWANFPGEQKRMFDLIDETKANGVFFISGDVHYSELSKIPRPDNYPIYDLTCSGLTEEWKFAAPNKYRIGKPVMDNHFGIIQIDWKALNPVISLEVWDKFDTKRILQTIPLEEISSRKN